MSEAGAVKRKLMLGCLACILGLAQAGCQLKKVPKTAPFRMADADVAVEVKVGELLGSDFVGELEKAEGLPMAPEQMKGKSLDEIVRSYLGIQSSDIQIAAVSVNTAKEKFLAVLVSAKAIDSKAVLAKLAEEEGAKFAEVAKHAGVSLYAPEGEADDVVLAFVGDKLIVIGGQAEVKNGLDNWKAGRSVKYGADIAGMLANAPPDATLTVAAVPSPKSLEAAPMPAFKGIKTVLVTARFGADLALTVSLNAKDESSAKDIRDMAAGGIAAAKQTMDPAGAPPEMAKHFGPIKDLLSSVNVGCEGAVVKMSATVKPEVIDAAGALIPPMLGMGGPPVPGGMPGPMAP